jgi:hypothetical protein
MPRSLIILEESFLTDILNTCVRMSAWLLEGDASNQEPVTRKVERCMKGGSFVRSPHQCVCPRDICHTDKDVEVDSSASTVKAQPPHIPTWNSLLSRVVLS